MIGDERPLGGLGKGGTWWLGKGWEVGLGERDVVVGEHWELQDCKSDVGSGWK